MRIEKLQGIVKSHGFKCTVINGVLWGLMPYSQTHVNGEVTFHEDWELIGNSLKSVKLWLGY